MFKGEKAMGRYRLALSTGAITLLLTTQLHAAQIVLQPGPDTGKDIWTTSVFSYDGVSPRPGGGLNDDKLVVGGWGDLYYSLLEFDLTGLPTEATSARLELYSTDQRGVANVPMRIDRITEAWDWTTGGTGRDNERLWWADRPTTTPLPVPTLPAPTENAWYDIDITSLYNSWQDGTYDNYGLQLRPTSSGNRWNEFFSSDYLLDPTLRPKLIIDYDPPEPPPAPLVLPQQEITITGLRAADASGNTDHSYTLSVTDQTFVIDFDLAFTGDDPGFFGIDLSHLEFTRLVAPQCATLVTTAVHRLQDAWELGAECLWSNRYTVTDGAFNYDVVLDVHIVDPDQNPDAIVEVHDAREPAAYLPQTVVDHLRDAGFRTRWNVAHWYTQSISGREDELFNHPYAAAHEIAHFLGLYDEYCGASLSSIDPAQSPDTLCGPDGDSNTIHSIMSEVGSFNVRADHIEKLLSQADTWAANGFSVVEGYLPVHHEGNFNGVPLSEDPFTARAVSEPNAWFLLLTYVLLGLTSAIRRRDAVGCHL